MRSWRRCSAACRRTSPRSSSAPRSSAGAGAVLSPTPASAAASASSTAAPRCWRCSATTTHTTSTKSTSSDSFPRPPSASRAPTSASASGTCARWMPAMDEMRNLRLPRKKGPWTAAVLCSAAGPCNHLDCHQGPFLVVFVCSNSSDAYGNTCIPVTEVYTYSSDAAAWSEPVFAQQPDYSPTTDWMGSALVGNSLYFGNMVGNTALKYDLELRQMSLILLPSLRRIILRESQLTTTDDGRLGLLNIDDDSNFCIWSRKGTHGVDAEWERRAIKLETVFPDDVDVTRLSVIGSGVGIILMMTWDNVYAVDLKTFKVKKLPAGTADRIIPYMSFYTPVLQVATT